MFFNGMRKYKDVFQVDMDELADAIMKDGSHQSLESRGRIAITHLHHLAPECAKDGCKCCLMDVFWYNVYLFVCFGHIKLWSICCPGHIIANHILVREQSHVLDCVVVLFLQIENSM